MSFIEAVILKKGEERKQDLIVRCDEDALFTTDCRNIAKCSSLAALAGG